MVGPDVRHGEQGDAGGVDGTLGAYPVVPGDPWTSGAGGSGEERLGLSDVATHVGDALPGCLAQAVGVPGDVSPDSDDAVEGRALDCKPSIGGVHGGCVGEPEAGTRAQVHGDAREWSELPALPPGCVLDRLVSWIRLPVGADHMNVTGRTVGVIVPSELFGGREPVGFGGCACEFCVCRLTMSARPSAALVRLQFRCGGRGAWPWWALAWRVGATGAVVEEDSKESRCASSLAGRLLRLGGAQRVANGPIPTELRRELAFVLVSELWACDGVTPAC